MEVVAPSYSDLEYSPNNPPPKSTTTQHQHQFYPNNQQEGGQQQIYQDGMSSPGDPGAKYQPLGNNGSEVHERRILGVRPPTFWLSLALVVVIIAAAVGGGVGGSMAVSNARSAACPVASPQPQESAQPQPTGTENSTSSDDPTAVEAYSAPTNITSVKLDCPAIDNTNLRITLSTVSLFKLTCGQEIGKPDIMAVVVYNHEDCARACASYNRNQGKVLCQGAVFDAEFSRMVKRNFGTCFLKANTTVLTSLKNKYLLGMVLE